MEPIQSQIGRGDRLATIHVELQAVVQPTPGLAQDLTAHRPRVSPGAIFIEALQASESIR